MKILIIIAFLLLGCLVLMIKSKEKSKLSIFLLLIFACYLIYTSVGYADYSNYKYHFEMIEETAFRTKLLGSHLYGYYLYLWLSSMLFSDFKIYSVFSFLIGLSLIVPTLKKYSNNYYLFGVLFLIYPFIMEIINIRYFLAEVFFVFSFRYYVDKRYFWYAVFVFVGGLFHSAILFFLMLIPFTYCIKKSNKFLMWYIFALAIIAITSRTINLNVFLNTLFLSDEYSYLAGIRSNFGWIPACFILLLNVLLVKIVTKETNDLDLVWTNTEMEFIKAIDILNSFSIGIGILYMYNVIFERLFRSAILIYLIYFSFLLMKVPKVKNRVLLYFCIVIVLMVSLSFFVIYPFYETVFFPIVMQ